MFSNGPIIKRSGIRDVKFGENVSIVEPVNIYECEIGQNTTVGPFVEIQKGVKIGNSCKIQSHSFVCELVTIGDHCFVGHGVVFINDVFNNNSPAGGNKDLWKPTKVGNYVLIGSNATILPVTVCDHTVIGAGAVVTKDILEPGVYAGNPARKIKGFEL